MDKMINRIQLLINKAEGTDNAHERETYLAKADELMVKYAIEQAEVDAARATRGEKPLTTPIATEMEIPVQPYELSWKLQDLLSALSYSIGVRLVSKKSRHQKEDGQYVRILTAIGYEMDIKYLEMLFMTLRMEMMKMLVPEVNPNSSYDSNVFTLHDAGVKWEEIAQLMNKHVTVEWADVPGYWKGNSYITREIASQTGPWAYTPWPDGGRLIRAYKRECKIQGVSPTAIPNSENYRADFAEGFTQRVAQRLRGERQSGELVLANRDKAVQDLYNAMFPPPPPLTDEELAALMAKKPGKAVKQAKVRYRSVDYNALARGRAAANRVGLARPGQNVSSGRTRGIAE